MCSSPSCFRPILAPASCAASSPSLLVAADATDPAATGNALAAVSQLSVGALRYDLTGTLAQRVQG